VDTLVGHSFGQLSALCVGDSISLEDAIRFVSGRARLIRDSWGPERGFMLSVEGDGGEVKNTVELVNLESDFRTDIACYNGPRSFVVAGDTASIEKVEEALQLFKLTRLKNTHAYHSYVADNILQDLRKLAETIKIQPPRIHVETCSRNGNWSQFTAEELVQHTRQPVYFAEAINRIVTRLPDAVWLEAGSASPIIAMARRTIGRSSRSDTFIPTDLGGADAATNLSNATGQLWRAGSAAKFWLFHQSCSQRYKNVNLPPYQFEETSHWIDYKSKSEPSPDTFSHNSSSTKPSLIRRVNGGAKEEELFLVDTSNAVFDLAGRGHAVAGQSLCPASMYIELAVRCAMMIPENSAGTVPHIEALTMSAPLGLGGDAAVFLRVRKTALDTWGFTVISQPQNKSMEDEVEHAKGLIKLLPAGDIVADSRLELLKKFARSSRADRVLSSASSTGISGSMVYKFFSDVVEYATYYRGVKSLLALENEVVGIVNVPTNQAFSMNHVICDPISLDNFLQVAGIHVNCLSNRKDAEVFMCTAVDEVIFSASFMTNRSSTRSWTVYSEYETVSKGNIMNDIFVYDSKSKELVLAIMGANFRSVLFKSLLRTLSRLNITTPILRNITSDPESDNMEDSGYQTSQETPPEYEDQFVSRPPKIDQLVSERAEKISDNLTQLVLEMFSSIMEIPVEEIKPTSKLDDLGVDSLLVTEVLSEIQKRFKVSVTQAQFMECVDVLSLCRHIKPEDVTQTGIPGIDEFRENHKASNKLPDAYADKTDDGVSFETPAEGNLTIMGQKCFAEAKPSYDEHADITGFANFCTEAFLPQSALVLQYVVEAFASLGCSLQDIKCGDELQLLQYDPKHNKLIPQLYRILEGAKLVREGNDGRFVRTLTPVPTIPASTLHSEMLKNFPKHASETKLLATTATRLADCLSGRVDPIGLMFGNATARALLEDVYTNAPMFKTGTLLLAQYLSSIIEARKDSRELRILELGAGTGGTTKHLVEKLTGLETKQNFTYTFTDLSASLVAAARRKFSKFPFMRYAVLNVEEDPKLQFLSQFDIVISTNCIHATKDLVQSTTNIRKMLRPDGVLCLVELTQNLFWFDLVFGLLEGWWLFNDGRKHALADERRWEACLHTAGFEWIDWSDSASQESDILRVITASPFRLPSLDANKADEASGDKFPLRETVVFKEVDGLQLHADLYYPTEIVDHHKSLPVGKHELALARPSPDPAIKLTPR
jgi:malonyl CoA-acyl carrier protein transacylase